MPWNVVGQLQSQSLFTTADGKGINTNRGASGAKPPNHVLNLFLFIEYTYNI